MTLIQSISGIRGTIGGYPGEGLSPVDIIKFAGAFGMWLKEQHGNQRITVVIGRDARTSGPMVNGVITSVFQALGIDVIDAGLSTTPTIEMGVQLHQAHGGVILTASHNPRQWNALKLLNHEGEFLTAAQGEAMNAYLDQDKLHFESVDNLGRILFDDTLLEKHLQKIMALPLVDDEAIRAANFRIVVDGINSVGGIAVPLLLGALGVQQVVELNCEPTGVFQHNPEPLPEHLGELSNKVVREKAHLGLALDPDVDRLAIVSEDGGMFGEEYTLVSVADYILSHTPGNTVSNMSSTQALAEVSQAHGVNHYYSPVGEVNVVAAMKEHDAVIGGEGNGGVIYPALHYGRDALVGIALFLTQLAKSGKSCSGLRRQYPEYFMSKNKIELSPEVSLRDIMGKMAEKYSHYTLDHRDGLKIWFDREWVHLRMSNTEPMIRLYVESDSPVKADSMANKIREDIRELLRSL
ncbi:MAG: phosphoglucosamine mutase [Bacteroidales bacterium]